MFFHTDVGVPGEERAACRWRRIKDCLSVNLGCGVGGAEQTGLRAAAGS